MHFCWDPPTETRVYWEKKGGKCMGEGHKKLNFSDCMGLAIGQIIGSGIISMGDAIPDVNMHSRPNTLANALTAISEKPTDPRRKPQAIAINVYASSDTNVKATFVDVIPSNGTPAATIKTHVAAV